MSPLARAAAGLRRHAAFAALALVIAPLMVAFAWQHGLATLNDDSASYLTLARWIEGSHTGVESWAWQHAHFPPLFPFLLVATRGSQSLVIAHAAVAVLGAGALVALYRFALGETGSRTAATALVAAFALMPTAWTSLLGILSEPLFLLVTLAALAYHARHLASPGAPPWRWLVFGAWLAAAYETRSAAVVLLAAYALHAALRLASSARPRRARLLLPFVPVLVAAGAWMALRPGAGGEYGDQLAGLAAHWRTRPLDALRDGGGVLLQGWVASFEAEGTAAGPVATATLAIAALALVGAVRRAARNALDGWYVLGTLSLLVFWNYGEDIARRLLYPVVPLMLLHAGEAVAALARRLRFARYAHYAVGAAAAFVVVLCVPAMSLLALRAADRAPLAGTSMAYANILEYYRYVNEARARQAANPQLATVIGLQALASVTEPGAKVAWMRPEYVAILGQRPCMPYEYGWDKLAFARALEKTGTRYIALSAVYKLDVAFALANPAPMFADLARFSEPYYTVTPPLAGRPQFILQRVDPARLRAYLAQADAAASAVPRR